MMSSTNATRWITEPLDNRGNRGYRLEIDEFVADNAMTNLFLLALEAMQKDSLKELDDGTTNWWNYYGIAGVHGQPQESFDGYPNTKSYGYCHHSKNTFPTWHKPYMMAYERAVHDYMVEQANKFQDPTWKSKYQDAAARFRLPYWDIIMPRKDYDPKKDTDPNIIWALPELLGRDKVFVRYPDTPEELTPINNPMYKFTFPTEKEWSVKRKTKRPILDLRGSRFEPLETRRAPGPDGKTDNDKLDDEIRNQAANKAAAMWQLLSPDVIATSKTGVKIQLNEKRSWNSFANMTVHSTDVDGEALATASVESFHNGIHMLVGTGTGSMAGVMSSPPVASYDPIFWMHHNNIDRMLALFQALYPGRNVDKDEVDNELLPFKKDASRTCWRSSDDMVKDYWTPGFAVPGSEKLDASVVKEQVRKYLTDTYYWATAVSRGQKIIPGTLPQWPKNLKPSEAIYGKDAEPAETTVLQMTAITLQAGVPTLVTRETTTEIDATPDDTKVKSADVLKLAHAIDTNLPDGTLVAAPAADSSKPTVYQTWNAHIKVRKFAFDGSFSIHFFIGYVKDEQPERYMTKKNEVGFSGIFASPSESACASCKENRDQDVITEDIVPLTTKLVDYLDSNPISGNLIRDGEIKTITSLEPEHVVPFLKEHLQWRMVDTVSNLLEGQEEDAKLEVVVTSRTYTPPTTTDLMGVYGPAITYPEITAGKAGGFSG